MYGTSLNRISGLASGMDTDSIVKKLMTAESVSLNKMKQNQQKLQWQSDGYRQWNSDMFSFYSNTIFNMKLSSQYGTYNVTSSNADAISGKASADAIPGTYNLKVDHLAQSATMVSNLSQNFDPTQTLGKATTLTLTTNNKTGNIDITKDDTIGVVVSKINSATDGSGNSLGLQAIYDNTLKQLIIRTKDTGANTSISISSTDATFLDTTLNFSASTLSNGVKTSGNTGYSTITTADADNQYAAADARVTLNGNAVSSSKNTLSIFGVSYTLKTTTNSNITINISRDLDTEVNNIKDFVSKYNDMLDKLNKAIDEPVYKDYQPLTDDQRSAMSDKQIEQWEAKAKSGLFHSDSIFTGLVNNIRNHITSTVANGSKYNSLASLGISSVSYADKGKLYVDETKLRAALQDDPDAVKNLFTQDPANAKPGQRGLIPQLYDDFKSSVQQLTSKAGKTGNSQYDQSVVGKLLSNLNTQILNEQQRLSDKENRYYQQFSAMEQAMNKYNSQGSWLSQQLSAGR